MATGGLFHHPIAIQSNICSMGMSTAWFFLRACRAGERFVRVRVSSTLALQRQHRARGHTHAPLSTCAYTQHMQVENRINNKVKVKLKWSRVVARATYPFP